MAIIVFILGVYLLALTIGCTIIMIWSIIQGIVKLILMILGALFEDQIKQAKKLYSLFK
jgi:hypothetical protein